MATDKIIMNADGTQYCSQFAWLSENGVAAIPGAESMAYIVGTNTRQHILRLVNTPAVVGILNGTSAGAQTQYNGFPLDNHFYMQDIGFVGGTIHGSRWNNGVVFVDNVGVPPGQMPDTGPLQMVSINSGRAVGIAGGGYSMYQHGKQLILYQTFSAYMTQLQTLP